MIADVMTVPLPMSIRTWDVVAPFLTSTILPLSWLRALSFFMVYSFQEFVLMTRCHHGCGRRQRLFSIRCLATISAPNCLFDAALKRAFGDTAACLPVWGAGAPTAASAIFASVDQTDRANRIDVVAAEFHRTLPQCGRAHELEESLRSGQEIVALPQN